MIQEINTLKDVEHFTKLIIKEGVNFNPDDDFREMVNIETNQPTYKEIDADERNKLMQQCLFLYYPLEGIISPRGSKCLC